MKQFLIKLFIFFISFRCFGFYVNQVFGDDNPRFISEYNRRLLSWYIKQNPEFKKCLSEQDELELKKIFEYWPSWGTPLRSVSGKALTLVQLNFEVFYQQNGINTELITGIRVHLPPHHNYKFRNIHGGANTWGIVLSRMPDNKCVLDTLFFDSSKKQRKNISSKNGDILVLEVHDKPTFLYPFSEAIILSSPIQRHGKTSEEILFLNSYNLMFFGPQTATKAVAHEKQFHQLPVRIKWKSINEYTIYYP